MPSKLRFLAKNLIEQSGVLISASPAQVSATLDENNLLRRTERARVARSSSLAAQQFLVTLPSAAEVTCAGVTRHNWTTSSTLRTRGSGTGSPSLILDSGVLTGYSTSGFATDIEDYRAAYFKGLKNTVQYFRPGATVSILQFDITDGANPDGYIEQTKLWAGKYFEVSYSAPFGGLDMTPMDASKKARADDGTLAVDVKWRARKLRLNLELIADADLPTMYAIANYLGVNGECLVDVYPEGGSAKSAYHLGAFQLSDSPTFNPHQVGLHRNTMLFEET